MYLEDLFDDLVPPPKRIALTQRLRASQPRPRDDEEAQAGVSQAFPAAGGVEFETRGADLETATDQLLRVGGLYRGGYRDRGVLESMLPDLPGAQDKWAPVALSRQAVAADGPPARNFGATMEERLDGFQRDINAQRLGLGLDPADWRADRAQSPAVTGPQAMPRRVAPPSPQIDRTGPSAVLPNALAQAQPASAGLPGVAALASPGAMPGAVGQRLERIAAARAAARDRLGMDLRQIEAAGRFGGSDLDALMKGEVSAGRIGVGGYAANRIPPGGLALDAAVSRAGYANGSGPLESPSTPQLLRLASATGGVSESGNPRRSMWQPELRNRRPPRQAPAAAPPPQPSTGEHPEVAGYLRSRRAATERYAGILGVPASAIEGVVGEEMRNVRTGEAFLEDNALQSTLAATRYGGTPQTVIEQQYEMYRDRIENGQPIGSQQWMRRFGIERLGRYAAKASGIILAQDIGVGNVNFGESIRLLRAYYESHPDSDPLNLGAYRRDYVRLYNDLRSRDSDVSMRFAALKVRDVIDRFNADPRVRRAFSRLDPRERDAAIDAGYRTSFGAIRERVRRGQPIYLRRDDVYDYFYDPRSPYNYAPYRSRRGR